MQPRRAASGEQPGEDRKGWRVRVRSFDHWPPDTHLRSGVESDFYSPLSPLGGLSRKDRLRSLACGKICKVLLRPGKNLIGVDVPDDGDDGVAGAIITPEVFFHVRPAKSLDIGHVS